MQAIRYRQSPSQSLLAMGETEGVPLAFTELKRGLGIFQQSPKA